MQHAPGAIGDFTEVTDAAAQVSHLGAGVNFGFTTNRFDEVGDMRIIAGLIVLRVTGLARAGLVVGEYAPNTVKKTVVGVGHADKKQVEHMVRMQLPGIEIAGPDASDALAIAICHAHHGAGAQTYREVRA